MEKGTRKVKCPNCLPEVTRIRIRITVAVYGKSVKISCPKCLQDFWTEIPVPAVEESLKQGPAGFPFGENPFDVFGDLFRKK